MTLREEYLKKKQKQALGEEKEQLAEILENYLLIAEKLDTQTIKRIVDAMNAVEDKLKPFGIRSLQAGLDAAEAELSSLISTKAGADPKKTGAMLGKALSFYRGISEFLQDDLPVLLNSRAFAQAKTKPDEPVGVSVVPMFTQALAVQKSGSFLKQLFSSSNIPYVDNKALAQELATLSYKKLVELSNVGKTPMVISQQSVDQVAQAATQQQQTPTQGTPAPAAGTGEQPAQPASDADQKLQASRGTIARTEKVRAAVENALSSWTNDPAAIRAATLAALDAISQG